MVPRRLLAPLLALAAILSLAPAGAARAAWFGAEPVDGPSPGIAGFGDLDLARDGSGALAYLKLDGGVPHVFVARMWGGAWRPPERVDVGVAEAASQPVVAAGDDGRLVVAWISEGRLCAAVVAGGLGQPFSPVQFLAAGGARDPDIDLGINGTAYVVYGRDGGGGSDVGAVRLQGAAWTAIGPALDIDPAQPAGDGAGRPRVAVAADGNAVAVWGEGHADGRGRLYARRLTRLNLSAYPQELSVGEFQGAPGDDADSPDIDIEDDGSYAWMTFRQTIGGASRVLARRLVGSTFDPPVPVDGGAGSTAGRVAITGRGVGLAASTAGDGSVVGSLLARDVFAPPVRLDAAAGTIGPQPVVAVGENDESAVAWLHAAGGDPGVFARRRDDEDDAGFEPQVPLTAPAGGPAAPDGRLEMAASRLGDFAVAFLQGAGASQRMMVASFDRPPSRPYGTSHTKPRRERRPLLKWQPGLDAWGTQTFKVLLGDQEIGSTTGAVLRPPQALPDGRHLWRVVATDRRGQTTTGRARALVIDATRPRVSASVARRAARAITLRIRVRDGAGTGLRSGTVAFGDGTSAPLKSRVVHRYNRGGRFTVTVRAVDKAGNAGRTRLSVRVPR
ncbi:MAG TPA: PKD domain-containing protein [Solirubrobacteraceae bacterium]|nr:PKD domain-containing protein [Solirubrobacteraceae bacterium]